MRDRTRSAPVWKENETISRYAEVKSGLGGFSKYTKACFQMWIGCLIACRG